MRIILLSVIFILSSRTVLAEIKSSFPHKMTSLAVDSAKLDTNFYIIKNNENLVPFDQLNRKFRSVSFGDTSPVFDDALNLFVSIQNNQDLNSDSVSDLNFNDILIVSFHADSAYSSGDYLRDLSFLNRVHKELVVAVVFGNPSLINDFPIQNVDALIHCPSTEVNYKRAVAHLLFGAIGTNPQLSGESSIQTKANGRLSFSSLEEAHLSPSRFEKIDHIAQRGIIEGAFPGCQILVSIKDSIVFRKSYGSHTYDPNSKKVTNDDVYDIASITKIAGSTLIAMYLEYRNMLDIDDTLGKYIPEITGNTEYSKIKIREMLAHQSGLKSWIPFYLKTMSEGQLRKDLYKSEPDSVYSIQVANNIYLRNDYTKTMYDRILSTNLGTKKYKYSDLCYYFTQKVFENILNQKQEVFLHEMIYEPLGLRNIRYLPLDYFEKERIVPTEHDALFRKQLIHGYVHDPGAAMLGGVGGHAGIFSNATDLGSIMQIFLKNGQYAGLTLFNEEIRKDFTRKQYENNRRGAGFDRPRPKGGGTCDVLASQTSFGHSGFTGALAWADPEHDIIFVFLSNRVNPDQENWKIRDMNIRTDIQHVIYEALDIH